MFSRLKGKASFKMWKVVRTVLVGTGLLVGLVLVVLSRQVEVTTERPPRPANVLPGALWVGGADGGVYVLVQKPLKTRGRYRTQVFSSSGETVYQGLLQLSSPQLGPVAVNEVESYSAWDGDTLYLRDGRQLAAVNK